MNHYPHSSVRQIDAYYWHNRFHLLAFLPFNLCRVGGSAMRLCIVISNIAIFSKAGQTIQQKLSKAHSEAKPPCLEGKKRREEHKLMLMGRKFNHFALFMKKNDDFLQIHEENRAVSPILPKIWQHIRSTHQLRDYEIK